MIRLGKYHIDMKRQEKNLSTTTTDKNFRHSRKRGRTGRTRETSTMKETHRNQGHGSVTLNTSLQKYHCDRRQQEAYTAQISMKLKK